MMQIFVFFILSFLWFIGHFYLLSLNDILKNADSFAYLQMASNLANFNLSWFWTWWFWFIYSLPIALFSFLSNDLFALAKYINLWLFLFGWFFLYKISKKYLSWFFLYLPIILYFTSSSLLAFNIQVISENIYIPLVLALVYLFILFFEKASIKKSLWISFLFALLYLTRAEAFVYLWSLFLIIFFLLLAKKIDFKKSLTYFSVIILWFFVFISPYLFYLHSITWEWSLTNKWSSNLRQASMRWIEKMDDIWFEKAVWELTPDKHHLMAWFAGWLKYDKSYWTWSTKDFLLNNPVWTFSRIFDNQVKLYSKNIPHMLVGDYIKLAFDKNLEATLRALIILSILVFLFSFLWGFYYFFKNKKYDFLVIFSSFFIIASSFFSIFFILDRYFIIFLPLSFIFCAYFLQNIKKAFYKLFLYVLFIFINISWSFVFYNDTKIADANYQIKKTAWVWLKNNYKKAGLKIMERWPITTYYAWSKERWLTPYTDNLSDIVEYAKYNKIDLFIVDNMDFATYRPGFKALLEWKSNYFWIEKLQEFQDFDKKVIIYKFK